MKFMLTWFWKPNKQQRSEGIARFLNTGGLPPSPAKLVGRWTRADFSGGFDLIETDDAKCLLEFTFMWEDLMELSYTPVLEDAQTGEVLKRVAKR
ncbi:MAG: DUF3303 family protein [Elusimicrobia bacterium]|nr:DUF3303 family protein [Elusimicrobiota bacterium]